MESKNNIWARTKNALLVVDYNSMDELKAYREGLKSVGLNINECIMLTIVKSKKEKNTLKQQASAVYITESEFNLIGNLKNETARKVMSQKFDVVLIVGDKSKRILKTIKSTKAKIIVGINVSKPTQLINLTTEDISPAHLINFAKLTLEKIE